MKKTFKLFLDYIRTPLILASDALYLWYFHYFFSEASTFLNIIGALLFLTLTLVTIKTFKK